MAKDLSNRGNLTHEEIAERARTIYEESGRIPGRDVENWLQAESQLLQARKAPAPSKNAPPDRPERRFLAKPAPSA